MDQHHHVPATPAPSPATSSGLDDSLAGLLQSTKQKFGKDPTISTFLGLETVPDDKKLTNADFAAFEKQFDVKVSRPSHKPISILAGMLGWQHCPLCKNDVSVATKCPVDGVRFHMDIVDMD